MDGLGFATVRARPVQLPELPGFIPQVRNRSALRGQLDAPAYAVRAEEVLRKRRVLMADELRERFGLHEEQTLILLPFAEDERLEALWDAERIKQIAAAGFDLVVAPSYSPWDPRPRTQHLVSLKRSLTFFGELQARGAPAIACLGWATDRDLQRMAAWVNANENVRAIAVDWQTYDRDLSFAQRLAGLLEFDQLTGNRLRYLVNGIARAQRYEAVFRSLGAERATVTNAKAPAVKPVRGPRATWATRYAAAYRACADEHAGLVAAARIAAGGDTVAA